MDMRRDLPLNLALGSLLALLGACGRTTAPDAVATVNGDVVTQPALDQEVRESGDGKVSRAAENDVLGRVVDRKLLAQEAAARELDRTPEFKLAEQKAREVLLTEMLARKITDAAKTPTPDEIKAYVDRHPAAFAARQLLTLDQLRVASASIDTTWFQKADTVEDAARILTSRRITFERGRASADTAMLPPQIAKFIAETPDKAFAYPQGDRLLVSQVVGRQRTAVPADQLSDTAKAMIRRDANQQAFDKLLSGLRAKAKVTYGTGYSAAQPKATNDTKTP